MSRCYYKKAQYSIADKYVWNDEYPDYGGYSYANYCPYENILPFRNVNATCNDE